MAYQWYRHTPTTPKEAAQQEGLLKRLVGAVLKPWEKVKHYGKALVGGAIYYYGNRIFWGGETSRYLYKRYRTIFQRMGFVRQAIIAYVNRIAAELPKPLSSSKQVMSLLEYRLKQVGLWEYYPEIVQDLLQFGDSFSEIIYSRPDFRVIGIKRLEPDYMYIQRDPYGRPLLYISVIDGIPVTIEPYRMMHIKLNPQPGDAFGVGLIEGGMDDLAALRILEDLNIQLVKHNIYPHRVYMCPSNDIVEQVEKKIAEQKRFGDLVVPMGVKAQQMMAGTGIDLRGFMLYYQQKFFLDVGVPMDMLIKGTGGNRATAEEMNSAFNGNARAIQRQILLKIEWFCELVLASEGIIAPVELIPPEIDKGLELARRQEIRGLYQEGLISRDFAQELLSLKHPLNQIDTPENFMTRLSQEKNYMEMFKLGLLTRGYAIKLLGHDVPENRPAQPQAPNFMLPMPGAPGGAPPAGGKAPGGIPMGNPDDPEMISPSEVEVITPTGAGQPASPNPAETSTVTEDNSMTRQKVTKIGLDFVLHENINMSQKMEGLYMAKPVQTIYIRKVNEKGEIENVPYVITDPRQAGKAGVTMADPRKNRKDDDFAASKTTSVSRDTTMNAVDTKKPEEKPLKPSSSDSPGKNEATPLDGDNGGIQTEPTRVPRDPNTSVEPTGGDTVTAPHIPADPNADAEDEAIAQPEAGSPAGDLPPDVQGAKAPEMPKPSPYFAPIDKGGKRPQFADIFGDNEHSIRRPQKHVERIREEMIDAYGQKHKRIHERTREHHKPLDANANPESDFIKKKKTSAERRWMKKSPSKVKNSQGQENEQQLVCIDIPLNAMATPWSRLVEETVIGKMEAANRRMVSNLKKLNTATLEKKDIFAISNIVAQEIMAASEQSEMALIELMKNAYHAGLFALNEAFIVSVEPRSLEADTGAVRQALADRCILGCSETMTEVVDVLNTRSVETTDMIVALTKVFDTASARAKNIAKSSVMGIFKQGIMHVLQANEVKMDIESIEFLSKDEAKTCSACKAHHMKNVPLKNFNFETCNSCETVYRVHLLD